jgi:hypothetical protein
MIEREAVSWNRLEREKMRRRSLCIPWRILHGEYCLN